MTPWLRSFLFRLHMQHCFCLMQRNNAYHKSALDSKVPGVYHKPGHAGTAQGTLEITMLWSKSAWSSLAWYWAKCNAGQSGSNTCYFSEGVFINFNCHCLWYPETTILHLHKEHSSSKCKELFHTIQKKAVVNQHNFSSTCPSTGPQPMSCWIMQRTSKMYMVFVHWHSLYNLW